MCTFNFQAIPELQQRKLFEMAKAYGVSPEALVAQLIQERAALLECADGEQSIDVVLPRTKRLHTISLMPAPEADDDSQPQLRYHDALLLPEVRSVGTEEVPNNPHYPTRYGP